MESRYVANPVNVETDEYEVYASPSTSSSKRA